MPEGPPRSRAARRAAEAALVRVVHHYGERPELVLLGGLVPELLCSTSDRRHAGTTDVDVQVDLEIACGSVNMARLELALRDADFAPDERRAWRWRAAGVDGRAVVKFELLTDLDDQPAGAEVRFAGCTDLGAANLRGTGFAARDIEVRALHAEVDGVERSVEVNVSGLAGFLLAKCAAAHARRAAKDWYDLAFVLLHNDAGGPEQAVDAVRSRFASDLRTVATALADLRANFADPEAQGPQAYARQLVVDHPEVDHRQALADAVVAVDVFTTALH